MKQRLAKKILKYREKLNYSEGQIKEAEDTLQEIEKRRAKRGSEKTEQKKETEE